MEEQSQMGIVTNLKNIRGRVLNIALEHPRAPRIRHTHYQRSHDRGSGKMGVAVQRLGIHDSLILLADEKKFCLPDWVSEVPDVKRLKSLGEIEVEKMPEEEAQLQQYEAERTAKLEKDALQKAREIKAQKRKRNAEAMIAMRDVKSKSQKAPEPPPEKKIKVRKTKSGESKEG